MCVCGREYKYLVRVRDIVIGKDLVTDLGDGGSDRLARPAIIRHLELDRVSQFQVLDVPIELAVVEEESCLSLAALDESVRRKQLFHDPCLRIVENAS